MDLRPLDLRREELLDRRAGRHAVSRDLDGAHRRFEVDAPVDHLREAGCGRRVRHRPWIDQVRVAQVGVHDCDASTRLRVGKREIPHDRRLALAPDCACDEDRPGGIVIATVLPAEHVEVRAKRPEALDEIAGELEAPLLPCGQSRVGHLRKHGLPVELLDVTRPADAPLQRAEGERRPDAEQQAEDKAEHRLRDDAEAVGGRRRSRHLELAHIGRRDQPDQLEPLDTLGEHCPCAAIRNRRRRPREPAAKRTDRRC